MPGTWLMKMVMSANPRQKSMALAWRIAGSPDRSECALPRRRRPELHGCYLAWRPRRGQVPTAVSRVRRRGARPQGGYAVRPAVLDLQPLELGRLHMPIIKVTDMAYSRLKA